jgi:hypothetical protein
LCIALVTAAAQANCSLEEISHNLPQAPGLECLSEAAYRNNFDLINFMLDNYYLQSEVVEAESTLRQAFLQIREHQDTTIDKFD